jgi:hypothetical protein
MTNSRSRRPSPPLAWGVAERIHALAPLVAAQSCHQRRLLLDRSRLEAAVRRLKSLTRRMAAARHELCASHRRLHHVRRWIRPFSA